MNAPIDLSVYKETLLFLVTAGVIAPLFFRLHVSPVLGYLLAGLALGPYGLGSLDLKAPWLNALAINVEAIDRIAAFGVVALLFTMGLELSFERLRRMRRLVFGLGLAQVVVTTLILSGVAWGLGLAPPSALTVGAALTMSSTAIVIPMLVESKRLHTGAGRASFAVLLFQDLAVAPLLVMTGAFSAGGERGLGWELVGALAPAGLGLVALVVFGRLALRPFFHFVAETKSPEFFMAACLLVVLGDGLAAAASHLSMALGAFVAGLLLAETEYRREIEVTIEPFRGLLLGLYFVSVGAGINPAFIARAARPHPRPCRGAGRAEGSHAVRAGARIPAAAPRGRRNGPFARAGRRVRLRHDRRRAGRRPHRSRAGDDAHQRGGDIDARDSGAGQARRAHRFARCERLRTRARRRSRRRARSSRVIIVGYGRVGALIGDMLDRHSIPFIAVDSDARVTTRARSDGKPVYYGDAARPEYLRHCGLETARAVVVTMDSTAANEAVVETTRRLRPEVTLVARARDADHARALYRLGVTDAVPETIEASLQLSEAVLVDLGVPMGLVIASIHEKRDEFRKLLTAAGAPERPRSTRGPRRG